jgi:hypothetical protein
MDAREQFEGFLSKYEPGVAAEAKKSLAKLRKLIPNAIEMVYDNYNALVVGFCPGMRPSEAIISIAVMPEWVSLCFLQGAKLPDPEKRQFLIKSVSVKQRPRRPGAARSKKKR